jgi:flagellar hook-associated protein 1 FlgK
MPLFSALQIANNALTAAQLGLQVTGNNIANANTPGYLRQQLMLEPAPTQRYGGLLLGLGVQVSGIIQQGDALLDERLRGAISDLADSEAQEKVYTDLETLLGELGTSDLSTTLTKFFGSLHDILNQPESVSVRNQAVLQGQTLANEFQRLDSKVRQIREDTNNRVLALEDEVNGLLSKVADLNVKILNAEGAGTVNSDAVGLRDQRAIALKDLAKIINIKTVEQPTGDVTVFAGGDYLVFQGTYREVNTTVVADRGLVIGSLRIAETDALLDSSSGELAGLITARDEVLGGFIDRLDSLARTLIHEFNKLHAQGQGLTGFSSLESEFAVDDTAAALDQAGLAFTPTNGSFQVVLRNKSTGITTVHDILVNLDGLDDDTSLEDLVTQLDGINGLSASLTADRRLQLGSESSQVEFGFDRDTSGVLAALGFNTFFSGSTAGDMSVNSVLRSDPSKVAVSSGGIGEDTRNGEALADLFDTRLDSLNGDSLAIAYDRFIAETTQGAAQTKSNAEAVRVFQQAMESQSLALSGVSLDEEAIRMLAYQRMFQASARFVAAIDEMLQILVNL